MRRSSPRTPALLVGTAHQPVSWWKKRIHPNHGILKLASLLVLSTPARDFFDAFMPGRVHLVRHGVDAAFFTPGANTQAKRGFRCVFSGVWLRDLDVLRNVVLEMAAKAPRIQFDFIIPPGRIKSPALAGLLSLPGVRWLHDLSDEQLRDAYREASVLLLPLVDATANNALLEGMACGLPVISTDVGGVRDCTEPGFATLSPPGDYRAMSDALLHLYSHAAECRYKGVLAREFVIQELAWPAIAKQTLELFCELEFEAQARDSKGFGRREMETAI